MDDADVAVMLTPEWPKSKPSAEMLRRFWVARGVLMTGVIQRAVDDGCFDEDPRSDSVLWARYARAVAEMQHAFDLAMALARLQQLDPSAADAVAASTWTAAEAGDPYGAWLWQWAEGYGLGAQAIYDQGKAAHDG